MSEVRVPERQLGAFWQALGTPERRDQPADDDIRRFLDRPERERSGIDEIVLAQSLRQMMGVGSRLMNGAGIGGHTVGVFVR